MTFFKILLYLNHFLMDSSQKFAETYLKINYNPKDICIYNSIRACPTNGSDCGSRYTLTQSNLIRYARLWQLR